MEVQVGHGLLARLADVGHHPVSGLVKAQLLGQLGNDLKNMGHHSAVLRRYSGNGLDVGLGHHQKMGGCLRGNVVEGIAKLVFLDLAAGDLPGDDLREQAIAHR